MSEVLRIHAPLFLLMRTVEQDVEYKGYTIRRGNVVACSPNVSQMFDAARKDRSLDVYNIYILFIYIIIYYIIYIYMIYI